VSDRPMSESPDFQPRLRLSRQRRQPIGMRLVPVVVAHGGILRRLVTGEVLTIARKHVSARSLHRRAIGEEAAEEPAASRQQGHAQSGSEAETEKTLEQEVPDGGADRQAHHREQGELSGFWLNHSATLHPWVGLGLRTDNYHDDRTIHRLGRRADRRRRDLDGWLVGVAEDGGLPPWIRC